MPRLLQGAALTLGLSVAAIVLSVLIGSAATVARVSGGRLLGALVGAYISFIRGTPLLVQILLIFYLLPSLGLNLPPVAAGIIALGVNSGAFMTEIMRGGVAAIPPGQYEAAHALGLSRRVIWRKVVFPQMFQLITPPLVNEFTMVIKLTPLVSVITVVEMMRMAQQMYNANFRVMEVLLAAAILYFVIIFSLSQFAGWLERRNITKFS